MSIFKYALLASVIALTGPALADDDPQKAPQTSDTNDANDMNDQTETTTTTTTTAPDTTTTVVTPEPAPTYQPAQPTYAEPYIEPEENIYDRYAISVALGGGVEGFASDTMSDTTDVGGSWDVRVAMDTPWMLGFEAAYIGSAQSINALGLDGDALLVGNGLDGKVRVNLLNDAIKPFAFAGVGWRHYSLENSDFNTSAVSEDDDVLEIPMGVGVAYNYEGFLLDARGEFRYATEEDLMPSQNTSDAADMHRWGVNANIGYAF